MNEKMQPKRMEDFKNYLQQQDKSPVTIKEYARQVSLFIFVVRRPRYDKRTEERHFKLFKLPKTP